MKQRVGEADEGVEIDVAEWLIKEVLVDVEFNDKGEVEDVDGDTSKVEDDDDLICGVKSVGGKLKTNFVDIDNCARLEGSVKVGKSRDSSFDPTTWTVMVSSKVVVPVIVVVGFKPLVELGSAIA